MSHWLEKVAQPTASGTFTWRYPKVWTSAIVLGVGKFDQLGFMPVLMVFCYLLGR